MRGKIGGRGSRIGAVSLLVLLAGCAVTPTPYSREELAKQAVDDRRDMFRSVEPLTGTLTQADALARALKFNLDKRAKMMEEALAVGQTDLDRFDMLPQVAAQAGYAGRNVSNLSRSINSVTLQQSDSAPTVFEDRDRDVGQLGVSWNILDFGVSYYTAHQNADRALIAAEHRRKAVQILVQDVRYAYWRAAAYQVLQPAVENAIAEANSALETARTVERENLKAPTEALRFQKALLETLRQLTAIQQDLSTAQIELAALISVAPGTEITLDVPAVMAPPVWTMPIDQMEERAFINNPDLHEQAYLARIAVDDTRKAWLQTLPGLSLSIDGHYDSNSFLVDKRWYETGANLSWSLVSIISAPDRINFAETNEDVIKARRLALRMAVLAQVHIAERQFHSAESQYEQSDALWAVDQKLAELARGRTASDAQGILERVLADTSAIASRLRRFQTYAQLEQAHGKILATLGDDALATTPTADNSLPAIRELVARRLAESADGGTAQVAEKN